MNRARCTSYGKYTVYNKTERDDIYSRDINKIRAKWYNLPRAAPLCMQVTSEKQKEQVIATGIKDSDKVG